MSLAAEYLPNYTVEDFQRWEGDWELIEGVPFAMSPSPSINHQRIERTLFAKLFEQLSECNDCELFSNLDWVISDNTVVRPDLLIVCNVKSEDLLKETPVLIIEILSKSTAHIDKHLKKEMYEQKGVEHYFIVNPEEKTVEINRLSKDEFETSTLNESNQIKLNLNDNECQVRLDFSNIWP